MGADTKANTLELVRVPSSPHQRLQRGVALESLCDRGCSFGTEPVVLKTAAGGFGGGVVSRVNGRWHKSKRSWGGGALELLEHAVLLDAARDDDGRGNAQPLVPEADLLGRLRAPELVNLKSLTIDTATGEVSRGVDTKPNTLGCGVAHMRLVICVSLRIAVSAETPLSPMGLFLILRERWVGAQ